MADDKKQTKAHDLLRRTFGSTTPMQSDERLMQGAGERAARPRPITPREYAEHLAGTPLTDDDLQPAQPPLARGRRKAAQAAPAPSTSHEPEADE